MDASADGSTVVGTGSFDGEHRPFIGSETTGLIDLRQARSEEWRDDAPRSVSRDGSVVVGGIRLGSPYPEPARQEDRAFLWTRGEGLVDLCRALEDRGIDTWEWDSLDAAWAVSADGSTIVEWGSHASVGVLPSTFHASLLPAPPVGVGPCDPDHPEPALAALREAFAESDPPCRVDIVDWATIGEGFRGDHRTGSGRRTDGEAFLI